MYYVVKLQVLLKYSGKNRFFSFLLAGNQPDLPPGPSGFNVSSVFRAWTLPGHATKGPGARAVAY